MLPALRRHEAAGQARAVVGLGAEAMRSARRLASGRRPGVAARGRRGAEVDAVFAMHEARVDGEVHRRGRRDQHPEQHFRQRLAAHASREYTGGAALSGRGRRVDLIAWPASAPSCSASSCARGRCWRRSSLLGGMPVLLSLNRNGRVAVEASIFLPDMVLQVPLPFRPVDLISDPPKREHVTIDYQSRNGPRSIEADLYVPAQGAHHSASCSRWARRHCARRPAPRAHRRGFGARGRGDARAVQRPAGRLRIEPEEIDALVAEFQYVQKLPQVDPTRVGFFGASVGGSLALVAAADPRIADEVDHVVSFGGYFDALTTFGAIATHHIEYKDVDENWTPKPHAEHVMAHQLIDRLDNPRDRDC